MKRTLLFMGIVAAIITGCTKVDEPAPQGNQAVAFSIKKIEGTRSALKTAWDGTESVGIFVGGDNTNYKYTVTSDGTLTAVDRKIYYPASSRGRYTAYYPYEEDGAEEPADKYALKIDVEDQVDFMVSNDVYDTVAEKEGVAFTFNHVLSAVTIDISAGDSNLNGLKDIKSLKINIECKTKAEYSIYQGEIITVYNEKNTIELALNEDKNQATALLLPGDYTATKLTVKYTDKDGVNFCKYQTLDKPFEGGCNYVYTLKLGNNLRAFTPKSTDPMGQRVFEMK